VTDTPAPVGPRTDLLLPDKRDPDIDFAFRTLGGGIEEIGMRRLTEGRDLTEDELRAAAFLASGVIGHVYGFDPLAARPAEPLDVELLSEAIQARHNGAAMSVYEGLSSLESPREVAEIIAAEYARLRDKEERHYPKDNCGNPDLDAILQAWYERAEKLLDDPESLGLRDKEERAE
jgi:hypothetical protein